YPAPRARCRPLFRQRRHFRSRPEPRLRPSLARVSIYCRRHSRPPRDARARLHMGHPQRPPAHRGCIHFVQTMKARLVAPLRRLAPFAGVSLLLSLPLLLRADETESDRAFFDREIAAMMEEHNVPGAAAVFVRGEKVEFTAGYGV